MLRQGSSSLPARDGAATREFGEEVEVFGASGGALALACRGSGEVGPVRRGVLRVLRGRRPQLSRAGTQAGVLVRAGLGRAPPAAALPVAFSDSASSIPIRNRWYLTIKNVPLRVVLRHLHWVVWSELVLWARAVYRRKLGAMLRAYREVFASRGRSARASAGNLRFEPAWQRKELERLLRGRGLKAGARAPAPEVAVAVPDRAQSLEARPAQAHRRVGADHDGAAAPGPDPAERRVPLVRRRARCGRCSRARRPSPRRRSPRRRDARPGAAGTTSSSCPASRARSDQSASSA